jgi:uncharacterized protein YecE (DUF72 family)
MGYAYKAWQDGVFYPAGMAPRLYLSHYSQIFNAVEMDNTFYGVPRPETVQRWALGTPEAFRFCPKTPRSITHEHRLSHEARSAMNAFLEAVRHFEEKLGPILIQFPPDFTADERPLLTAFLLWLPEDLRFAVEFRDRSWYKRSTSEMLQELGMAWVSTDYIYMPRQVHATTDFIYLRLLGRHGAFPEKQEEQLDSTERLEWWWEQIQPHLLTTEAVYVFANNDYAGHSPTTCNKMKRIMGLPTVPTRPIRQSGLFNGEEASADRDRD